MPNTLTVRSVAGGKSPFKIVDDTSYNFEFETKFLTSDNVNFLAESATVLNMYYEWDNEPNVIPIDVTVDTVILNADTRSAGYFATSLSLMETLLPFFPKATSTGGGGGSDIDSLDDVPDSATRLAVSPTEKSTWNAKQDALSKASASELSAGSDDAKYATALALANSKYLSQDGAKVSATASGTDTYTATISPAIAAYSSGQRFYIMFTNANTGAATINLNSLGAKAIRKNGATALVAGDISAGQVVLLAYDGTNFQIVGNLPKDIGEQVLTITPEIWTATTNGPTSPSHTWTWSQDGKEVTVRINFIWGGVSNGASELRFALPAELPTPLPVTGRTAANSIMTIGDGILSTSGTTLSAISRGAFLAVNANANGYVLGILTNANLAIQHGWMSITYRAA